MAITKKQKQELVRQYGEWIDQSNALILAKYIGLSVGELEQLRRDIRQVGGEFHIVKNTLVKLALQNAGLEIEPELFLGDTAVGFAFEDAPGLAKAIVDLADESDFLDVKAGYFNGTLVGVQEIVALSKVPPLPILRAQLLGTLMAPATKLAQILAEPGRQIASVLKAYADANADAAPEAA